MTQRLILIRHAKSSWDDPFADDHARVLNRRGEAAADRIGAWLAEQGYLPDVMLCSDAMRTRQTAARIITALPDAPKLQQTSVLYHASPDTMFGLIAQQSAEVLALVGHNPGIGLLAAGLVVSAPAHDRFDAYPTCAVTVIEFDRADWAQIAPRTGRCLSFVVPRDLD